MRRRSLVATLSSGVVVSLGGCSTSSTSSTSQNARVEVVEYDVPETVEIGSAATISITVRNVGDVSGDISAPLYVRTPNSEWTQFGNVEMQYEDVEPGETATDSVQTEQFDYIQRYEFVLGDSDKTSALQTVSKTLAWEEEFTTPSEYRIRIDRPVLQSTFEVESYAGSTTEESPEDRDKWAFVDAWVKNETGQTQFSPVGAEFALLHQDSQFDALQLYNDPVNKGPAFDGGELQPGVEREGWLAYAVPGEVGVEDLTMAWSTTTRNGEVSVNWSSGDDG